jgi:hypothetical protein
MQSRLLLRKMHTTTTITWMNRRPFLHNSLYTMKYAKENRIFFPVLIIYAVFITQYELQFLELLDQNQFKHSGEQ